MQHSLARLPLNSQRSIAYASQVTLVKQEKIKTLKSCVFVFFWISTLICIIIGGEGLPYILTCICGWYIQSSIEQVFPIITRLSLV